ncbi:MAG: ammonium transporter [Actinomycetes bacterium]
MRRSTKVATATTALWVLGALPAMAQEEPTIESLAYDLDVVWVAAAAAFVFLMQLGFAMLEAGLVRAKNVGNIVAKNIADMSIGAVFYWAIGAALAYGATSGGLFGTTGWFAGSVDTLGDGTQFVFQMVFAATAATIVSGAIAERMKFTGYLLMSVMITAIIYPIVTHWQWGGGWLSELGFYDFAGSTLVHMTGGVAALMGAAILGPRIGKYGKDGKPRALPGHNVPFAIFGVFILWFGWFGFNGGSTLGATGQGAAIGNILLTTNVAAGAGALAAGIVIWMTAGKLDPTMAGNGALAGLVGITAGPDYASGPAALLVGLLCGTVVVFAVRAFDAIKIDDPVGAVSVHGVCGMIGTLAVPFYPGAADAGITLGTQAIGVASVAGFVAVTSGLVFLALKAIGMLRVSEQEEMDGLDVHEHGVASYPDLVFGGGSAAGAVAVSMKASAQPVTE